MVAGTKTFYIINDRKDLNKDKNSSKRNFGFMMQENHTRDLKIKEITKNKTHVFKEKDKIRTKNRKNKRKQYHIEKERTYYEIDKNEYNYIFNNNNHSGSFNEYNQRNSRQEEKDKILLVIEKRKNSEKNDKKSKKGFIDKLKNYYIRSRIIDQMNKIKK